MLRRLLAVCFLLAACGGPSPAATETTDAVTTPAGVVETTTTLPELDVAIQNCASPPVTFSPLCEIYDLLETWYVDLPLDHEALARLAVEGVSEYTTEDRQEPPRTLFCSVPRREFTILCDAMAKRVREAQIPVGPAVEAAVSHMIDVGLGPFTYYLPPDQAAAFRVNGVVGGIGVLLDARDAVGSKCTTINDVCRLEIVAVLEGNPGFAAGLMVGDIITAVDGEPVDGRGFTAVVTQIAGDETGVVDLSIERDGDLSTVEVDRAELEIPTVEYGVPIEDVGYIRIPDFELDIPELVSDSLAEIVEETPRTLVVDLRDNPGGYVDAFVDVADEFVDGGVIMVSDAPDEHLEYTADPGGIATTQRLVVLVNQGTASAAEILTGTLRDRRDAVVLGTNTYGKDAVQIPFTLRNGGEFHVAVAHWSTPAGESAENGGLTPDLYVEWPVGATVEDVIDLALEASS